MTAATALARILLRFYPRSFRREVGAALIADVGRRAGDLAASRGRVGVALWLPVLTLSLVLNGAAAWSERLLPRRTSFSWLDVKLAVRMLIKYPGLSLTGGLGIAVGMAIGVGYVSFMQFHLHPTVPLDEGHRMVGLENWDRRTSREDRRSVYDFGVWRSSLKSVEDLSAFHTIDRNLVAADGTVEPVRVASITPSGFRLARVPPLAGRALLDSDAALGAPPVAVIGFDVWRRRFALAPDVVGRDLRLGGELHTIVGVMPEGFQFPVNHRIWTPFRMQPSESGPGEGPQIYISGRLAPGFELDDAQAEIEVIGKRLAAEFPASHGHLRPEVLPYAYPFEGMSRTSADATVPMLIIVSLLLVVVAVNVAVLVYARTAARRAEIAVRSALGASRARIVGQMFAESLVLCAISGMLAVFFVNMLLEWMERAHRSPPFWTDYRLSPAAIAYAAAVTVLAAVITGVIPALQATGQRMQRTLQQVGSRSGPGLGRTWTTLVVVQVAVAVAAVPIAAALSWSQIRGEFKVPAYPIDQFVVAGIGVDQAAAAAQDTARFARLRGEIARRLAAQGASGHTFSLLLPTSGRLERVDVENDPAPSSRAARREAVRADVDAAFFTTFDLKLLAGRGFQPADHGAAAEDVVIVNRAFAAQRLAGGNPLGRRIVYRQQLTTAWVEPRRERSYQVIGVVDDFDASPFHENYTEPRLYHPLKDAGPARAYLTVRMPAIMHGSAERLRALAAQVDPALVVDEVITLAELHRLYRRGLVTAAGGLVVGLSSVLLLSAGGIYALMSFTVTSRRREIAIRTALGAQPGRLLGGIFRHALKQISIGIACGTGFAVLLDLIEGGEALQGSRLLLLGAMVVVMTIVGVLAALGPARRGLRIEPLEALRTE